MSIDRETEGATMEDAPISRLMKRAVICIRPEQSVAEVARLLLEKSIGGAPVVDASGKLLGMVSKTDVIRSVFPGLGRPGGDSAAAIMTPATLTAPQDASVLEVADVMMRAGIHRIVVVDALDRVVGVVSSLDIIRHVARHKV